jgi:hypothetical protein
MSTFEKMIDKFWVQETKAMTKTLGNRTDNQTLKEICTKKI